MTESKEALGRKRSSKKLDALTISGIFYALWHCFHDCWLHLHLHFTLVILIINAWFLHPNYVLLFIVKCDLCCREIHPWSFILQWLIGKTTQHWTQPCMHAFDRRSYPKWLARHLWCVLSPHVPWDPAVSCPSLFMHLPETLLRASGNP